MLPDPLLELSVTLCPVQYVWNMGRGILEVSSRPSFTVVRNWTQEFTCTHPQAGLTGSITLWQSWDQAIGQRHCNAGGWDSLVKLHQMVA